MPYIIRINTLGELKVKVKKLDKLAAKLPEMTREGMRRWGKILEKDMKASAKDEAHITPSGGTNSLFTNGIRYEQAKRGNIGKLFIRQYGIYLDSMRPHYVNIQRSRPNFVKWGKRARDPDIRAGAYKVEQGLERAYGIYVQPHPFIRSGYRRARPKLTKILQQQTQRSLSSSFGGKNV